MHCTFSKAIVGIIEEYSLSGECLERLDLGLNNGWISFRARFIKLFFSRFHRKKNPKKVLTGAERVRKFRVAHHATADLRKLADKKLQITTRKLQAHHIKACAGQRESSRQGAQSMLQGQRKLTSAAEKIYFLR